MRSTYEDQQMDVWASRKLTDGFSVTHRLLIRCLVTCAAIWSQNALANVTWNKDTHTAIVADFNGDGYGDIFLHAKVPGNQHHLIHGGQQSSYTVAKRSWNDGYLGINWRGQVVAGDFNGDSRDDLLVQSPTGGVAWVLLATEGSSIVERGGDFTSVHQYLSPSVGGISWSADQYRLAVGDFSGDGRADVFAQSVNPGMPHKLLLAEFDGRFSAATHCCPINEERKKA